MYIFIFLTCCLTFLINKKKIRNWPIMTSGKPTKRKCLLSPSTSTPHSSEKPGISRMELSTQQSRYRRAREDTVHLTVPELVGFYSLDANQEYLDDFSQLKFISRDRIKPREVNMDLNHNLENRNKRGKGEGLRGLLSYLKTHRNELNVFSKSPITMDRVPFVCCRGSLRAISKQPYENLEPFRLSVWLANGVIYMHSLDTPEKRIKEDNMTERQLTMTAWGYKFEQYMVSEETNGVPDLASPVDENSEFNGIYISFLKRHKLFFGAEMDAFLVDENTKKIDEDWEKNIKLNCSHNEVVEFLRKHKQIELKTSPVMVAERQYSSFRKHKCLTWWLQSYIAGNDMVVCGFKNDHGIVTEIKQYKTNDLPKQAQDWSTSVCLNFCDEYLRFIKQALTNELKRQGYSIGRDVNVRSYPPVNIILHRKLKSPVIVDSPMPNEDTNILGDWFLEMLPKYK